MKSLEAFWHWVENEKPPASGTADVRDKTCTEVEVEAAGMAMDAVKARAGFRGWNHETFYEYLEPVRDLSLAICAALERMHEAVPEAETFEHETPEETSTLDNMSLAQVIAERNRLLKEMWDDTERAPRGILIAGTPAQGVQTLVSPEQYLALPDLVAQRNTANADTKPRTWDERRELLEECIANGIVSLSDPETAAVYEEVMRQCDALPGKLRVCFPSRENLENVCCGDCVGYQGRKAVITAMSRSSCWADLDFGHPGAGLCIEPKVELPSVR